MLGDTRQGLCIASLILVMLAGMHTASGVLPHQLVYNGTTVESSIPFVMPGLVVAGVDVAAIDARMSHAEASIVHLNTVLNSIAPLLSDLQARMQRLEASAPSRAASTPTALSATPVPSSARTSAVPSPTLFPSSACVYSEWSPWSLCSKSCGGGSQARNRTILLQPTGSSCSAPFNQTTVCNTHPCTVDCVVTDYGAWSPCSVVCGGGTQYRVRSVSTQPAHGGAQCPPLIDFTSCNTNACPVTECTGGTFSSVAALSALQTCIAVRGNLTIAAISTASTQLQDFLGNVRQIGGNLRIVSSPGLVDVGLPALERINGSLLIENLDGVHHLSSFGALEAVGGSLVISDCRSLTNMSGFTALQTVGGRVELHDMRSLQNISLPLLTSVRGSLSITNAGSLSSMGRWPSLAYVGGDVNVTSNTALRSVGDLGCLEMVGGEMILDRNPLLQLAGLGRLSRIRALRMVSSGAASITGLQST
jgi:hypothetical protein